MQVVIRDFRYKSGDRLNVVTAYFSTQLEVVSAAVQEKFDLIDEEDDPRIIEAALQDDDFVALLRGYFAAGDTARPKYFKTLATMCALQGQTLLHLCCPHALDTLVSLFRPAVFGRAKFVAGVLVPAPPPKAARTVCASA